MRKLAEQVKTLGDPTRLRILKLLSMLELAPSEHDPDCPGVYNVTKLGEELGVPQTTVSHHLKVLYNAGLLRNKKLCRDVYYWIDRNAFAGVLDDLKAAARFDAI